LPRPGTARINARGHPTGFRPAARMARAQSHRASGIAFEKSENEDWTGNNLSHQADQASRPIWSASGWSRSERHCTTVGAPSARSPRSMKWAAGDNGFELGAVELHPSASSSSSSGTSRSFSRIEAAETVYEDCVVARRHLGSVVVTNRLPLRISRRPGRRGASPAVGRRSRIGIRCRVRRVRSSGRGRPAVG
jgi:hypothetical protein